MVTSDLSTPPSILTSHLLFTGAIYIVFQIVVTVDVIVTFIFYMDYLVTQTGSYKGPSVKFHS